MLLELIRLGCGCFVLHFNLSTSIILFPVIYSRKITDLFLSTQFIFIPTGPNTGPGPTAQTIHFRARDYKGTESKYGL